MSKDTKASPLKEFEDEPVNESDAKAVEETCEKPLNEADNDLLYEIYADAFYEESHGIVDEHAYVNEYLERPTKQDEEALMELLAEEDRDKREMEERMRQDREFEDLLWKIEYGIAETEDFGNYRYETNWDVLLNRLKGPIH